MNLKGFTIEQVEQAVAVCNAGEYAGQLRFDRTDREERRVSKRTGNPLKPRYISGVLRFNSCEATGALVYPHRRTRYADWQTHYDFMEQLLLQQPEGRITSRLRGVADYHGLLGFYGTAGRLKSQRLQLAGGIQTTFGAMPSNRPEVTQ